MAKASNDTIIQVVACRKVFTGRNSRGDLFSVFEVDARDRNGSLIQEQLRSFEVLPIGERIEVTVTPFDSTEYGRSYTVHPKGSQSFDSDKQYRELATVTEELRSTVESLSQRVTHMQAQLDTLQYRQAH